MRKILYIVILLSIVSCGNRNKVCINVLSDYGEVPLKLWVDGIVKYDGIYNIYDKKSSYDYVMLAAYVEKKDTLRTFRIRIMDKDTTFIHDMTGVYEINISVLSERGFVIFDNHDILYY